MKPTSSPLTPEVAVEPPEMAGDDELERLRYENEKLQKINRVLMRRVEMGWGNHSDAYQSFEDAAMLADKVKERTYRLQQTLHRLEESNQQLELARRETEKSQIQALDRTQPGLPIKPGRCGTMTHDYKRNGTTTLFAALNIADGEVIGCCMQKHRHQEWIRFLNTLKKHAPKDKEIHIICDNYSTHKHAKVKAWEKRNKRFHFHFTPTSASWLNMVERFFRDLTENRLKRGVFKSTAELIEAIEEYIQNHNKIPSPSFGRPPQRTF